MIKRNTRFEVRLARSELQDLDRKARKAGLTRGAFLRAAIAGTRVYEAPPADVPDLIQAVRRVGEQLEQIMQLPGAKSLLDISELKAALEENRRTEKLIVSAYGALWR